MRIVRFKQGRRRTYGIVEGERVFAADGDPIKGLKKGAFAGNLKDLQFLPPIEPTKILAIGRNYLDHIKELGAGDPSEEPIMFIKPNTVLRAHGDAIVMPAVAGRVDYEGELVAVIGKQAKNVPEKLALDYVLGYTCGNDVTARDLQRKDGQWTRGKGFDGFGPIGPVLLTAARPEGRHIVTRVNGKAVQESNTDLLIFNVARLVSFISYVMTLYPGDIIFTGTPSGIGPVKPGDVMEVEIEGVGILRNPVVAEKK